MRALMLLAIALAATAASQLVVAAPGDTSNSTEATPSPTSAENAAPRAHASAPAASSATPAAGTAASSTASTDAPVRNTSATETRPPAATPGKATQEEEEFRIPSSYKARMKGDETVYCRKEGESGTRFRKTACYTLAELKYKVEAEKAAADDITRRARVCSNAAVCSSN